MYSQSGILEENAFVLNNYDIVESHKSQNGNVTTYVGSSFFDNDFYMIKRKRLENTANENDISNKEQTMLQSLQHEGLARYVMSFYLNRSIYIFFTAAQQNLKQIMPIKNQRKSLNYFHQICKAVKYLHDKKLVVGSLNPSQIFISKNKAFLAINNIFDFNKGLVKFKQPGHHKSMSSSQKKACLYFAPEETLTPAGDVWSLGIILHEILTGHLPYN